MNTVTQYVPFPFTVHLYEYEQANVYRSHMIDLLSFKVMPVMFASYVSFILSSHPCVKNIFPQCKAKRQYKITLQVSRYFILALKSRFKLF